MGVGDHFKAFNNSWHLTRATENDPQLNWNYTDIRVESRNTFEYLCGIHAAGDINAPKVRVIANLWSQRDRRIIKIILRNL